MKKSISGYTLIEVLTVIAIITILVAISIVSYGATQRRAYMASVRSDLYDLNNAMELYRLDNERLPTILMPRSTPQVELETVLREAGLYASTRANQVDWNNGIFPPKRFVFCFPADTTRYAIVSDRALLTDSLANDIGKTTLFVDQTGAIQELTVTDIPATSVQNRLCSLATGENIQWDELGRSAWSNNIPVAWAP